MTDLSLQIVALELQRFLHQIAPAAAAFAYTLTVWMVSRFVAKDGEQRRILRHMPQVVRDEIERRDGRIAELETAQAELSERLAAAVATLRMVGLRAEQTRELVAEHLPVGRLRLIERKAARG